MNNFILSAEGGRQMNRGTWATHKILGAFESRAKAVAAIPADYDDEDIVLVTDLTTMKVERVGLETKEACTFCETPVDSAKPETLLIKDGVTNDLVCAACYSAKE